MLKKIIVLVLLLLALPLGLFLVQWQQILKSKASLQAYNAFGISSSNGQVSCDGNICSTNTLNITFSLRDLTALEVTQEVAIAKSEEPVVDDQSQNSALSAYFKSAQDVADKEDQEFARERGLPDAQTQNVISNLSSALENGQQIPDELWQDYGSKLGNLSQGAVDLVTSQVQEAQEKGEQKKAEEAINEVERRAEQDEQEYLQGLEQWKNATPEEKAQQIKTALNLPPETSDEDTLNIFNKAAEPLGINVKDQGSGNFVFELIPPSFSATAPEISASQSLVSTTPLNTTPFCDALEGEELSRCQKTWEDGANMGVAIAVGSGVFATAPFWVPVAGSAIVAVPAVINAGSLQLYVYATGAGSALLANSPRIVQQGFGILAKHGDTIINASTLALCEASVDPSACIYENYAQFPGQPVLNESANLAKASAKAREGVLDVAVSKAFEMVGSAKSRGTELLVDLKTVLKSAEEAGTEGLEGVWVGGQRLATDERGSWDFFGLIRREEPKNDIATKIEKKLSEIDSDNFRGPNGNVNLQKWEQSAEKTLTGIFGNWAGNKRVVSSIVGKMESVPPDELLEMARQVDEAYAYVKTTDWRVGSDTPPGIRQVTDAYKYDSLWARAGGSPLQPQQLVSEAREGVLKAEFLEALLQKRQDINFVLRDGIEDTERGFRAVKEFSVEHGANPASFGYMPEAIDPSVIHNGNDEVFSRLYSRKFSKDEVLNGLYRKSTDKNIIVRSGESCTHECTHRLNDLANPSGEQELIEVFGSRVDAERLADRLNEGATERFASSAQRFAGVKSSETTFGAEIKAVDEIIAQVAENLHLTPQQAEAKFFEAQASGRLAEFVKEAGPERAAEILRNNPTKSPDRFGREIPISPLEKNLAIADALEDIAKLKGTDPKGNSGKLPWNLLVGEVLAQGENLDNSILNSTSFELLVKMKLAKRALERSGRLDNRYIGDLLKRDIFAPEVVDTKESLLMVTGKMGTTESEIGEGRYLVTLDSMQDLDIKVPSVVEVKAGTTIVPIGIREGSGKVEKTTGLGMGIGREESPKVRVAAFYDENGNGKWDGSEKALPWAGIQVSLTKVNQEKVISLIPGWNLITLPALPVKPLTAKGLLAQIAKQGGNATAVSTLENGAWKSYVVEDHQDYSKDNFTIEPGKAYFVNSLKRSTLSFIGQEFASPVRVSLKEGWNAVGFPKTSKQFKARDLGASGDFTIEENKGYLLNLKKGVDFSP